MTAIKNYTTTIAAEKSIGEIQKILSARGVTQIMVSYEDAIPVSLSFTYPFQGQVLTFALPCRWEGVQKVLEKAASAKHRTKAHAVAVGWRILRGKCMRSGTIRRSTGR